jgi:hypothetical protein
MPLPRRFESSALLSIAAVGCAYLSLLVLRNVPLMKSDHSCGESWQAIVGSTGVYGIVWAALAICAVSLGPLVLLRRRRLTWPLAAILVLGALGLEAAAMYRRTEYRRTLLTMYRLRDIGQWLRKLGQDGGHGLPPQLPDDIASGELSRDGWGFPIWYRRLTPDHAYLVACGSDGTRETQVPVPPPLPRPFPPSDLKHDIVYELRPAEYGVSGALLSAGEIFIVYPAGPAQGEACSLRSAFGCLVYW